MILLVLLAVVLFLIIIVMWIVGLYNKLVLLDENVNNAMSQIGVQLTSRFDALTGLLDLVKGYNEHEYKTLTDIIKMRSNITGKSSAKDVDAQENIITETVGKIVAVAENYPDLKSNTNYQSLMNSLNDYEDKVRKSRLVYNDTVTKLNRTIRMFPMNMIAPMFSIVQRDYLETDEKKSEMPSMK